MIKFSLPPLQLNYIAQNHANQLAAKFAKFDSGVPQESYRLGENKAYLRKDNSHQIPAQTVVQMAVDKYGKVKFNRTQTTVRGHRRIFCQLVSNIILFASWTLNRIN